MRKVIIILLALTLSGTAFGNKVVFGGKNRVKAYALSIRNEQNMLVAGITRSYGGWFDQAYLANINYADSVVVCEKAFFSNATFCGSLPITNSKIMAYGKTQIAPPSANFQCMAALFYENCDTICTFLSGSDGDDALLCGTLYKSNAYLGGYIAHEHATKPYIIKLDSMGNEIFAQNYTSLHTDSIIEIATNGVDIWTISASETTFVFAKITETGELGTMFSIKRGSGDFIRGMLIVDDGIIVCGARGCNDEFREYDLCLGKAFLEKLSFTGQVSAKAIPCNFEGCIESIVQTSPDSIFAVGFAAHKDSTDNITLDSYGAVFSKTLHGLRQATADLHAFENVTNIVNFQNKVYVAGEFSKDPCCHWDIFIAEFDSLFQP